jgi:acetyltransferase-like isoleucine patch superfamily enzyme
MNARSETQDVIRVFLPHRGSSLQFSKRCLQWLFGIVVLPRFLLMQLNKIICQERALIVASESIAGIPGQRGVFARQAFYRMTLAMCGQDVYFGWLSVFSMKQASVGDRAYIGRFCSIGYAEIGDEVMLADHVQILSGGNEHSSRDCENTMQSQSQTYQRIRIGKGAWIGAGAIVMADVGQGAIVGAGAVVTRPIPDHCVAVGVPARVIKQTFVDADDFVPLQPNSSHPVSTLRTKNAWRVS